MLKKGACCHGLDPKAKGTATNNGVKIGSAEFNSYPGDYVVGVACDAEGSFYNVSLRFKE